MILCCIIIDKATQWHIKYLKASPAKALKLYTHQRINNCNVII